jgi:hypothetical protein
LLQISEFKKFIEDMAASSLRCVAFAYRTYEMVDVPSEDRRADWILPEDDLIMLGIVGIKVSCECTFYSAVEVIILVVVPSISPARAVLQFLVYSLHNSD